MKNDLDTKSGRVFCSYCRKELISDSHRQQGYHDKCHQEVIDNNGLIQQSKYSKRFFQDHPFLSETAKDNLTQLMHSIMSARQLDEQFVSYSIEEEEFNDELEEENSHKTYIQILYHGDGLFYFVTKENKVSEISIHSCNLTKIPKALYEFSNVTINFYGNNISEAEMYSYITYATKNNCGLAFDTAMYGIKFTDESNGKWSIPSMNSDHGIIVNAFIIDDGFNRFGNEKLNKAIYYAFSKERYKRKIRQLFDQIGIRYSYPELGHYHVILSGKDSTFEVTIQDVTNFCVLDEENRWFWILSLHHFPRDEISKDFWPDYHSEYDYDFMYLFHVNNNKIINGFTDFFFEISNRPVIREALVLIVPPDSEIISNTQILSRIKFQEKYFDSDTQYWKIQQIKDNPILSLKNLTEMLEELRKIGLERSLLDLGVNPEDFYKNML